MRHGHGITRYQHERGDLAHELAVFVAIDDPVKLSVLTLVNRGTMPRRLRAYAYCEWSLGPPRADLPAHVVTARDPARDGRPRDQRVQRGFPGRAAFLAAIPRPRSTTSDRLEVLGRFGSPRQPAALARERLGGRFGAGLDRARALEVEIEIPPGEERTITFLLGQGRDRAAADALLARYADPAAVTTARERVATYWTTRSARSR